MRIINKNKKILIVIAIVVLAFIFYSVFLKPDAGNNMAVVSLAGSSGSFTVGRDIITLLADLKSINLSGELFNGNVFRSLEDFSVPIVPEPQGRINPFAPIGVISIVWEPSGAAQ